MFPAARMKGVRVTALAGVVLLLAAHVSVRALEQPERLLPETPKDGASVGKKPRFALRAEGGDAQKLRYRIELSRDGFETIAYTFDQLKEPNGWAYTELPDGTPGAVYFSRQALAGGDYLWRVASWDGLSWRDGHGMSRLQVDDVPPGEVEDVRMSRSQQVPCVHITWNPVAVDRDGRPERVAAYHVYRYTAKGTTHPIRPFEAGATPELQYDDCDPAALTKPILYYRVVAEDEAGNIPGRRY